MIEDILNYASAVNANKETIDWINIACPKALLKNKITVSELEHIVDYFNSGSAPIRLHKMSVADAKRKADEWMQRNKRKGKDLVDGPDDITPFLKFKDGTKIVLLKSQNAFKREGFLMSHCLGGYSPKSDMYIYSYRDKENMPHATFEVRKNSNEIVQIKGKGNGAIHPKYIKPVLAFLKKLGIKIRPNDMVNLGCHHIDKTHIKFLKKFDGIEKQMTKINGEYYAF